MNSDNSRPMARHWLINVSLWRARRSGLHRSYRVHPTTDTFYVWSATLNTVITQQG
jgi:hypothetical protein